MKAKSLKEDKISIRLEPELRKTLEKMAVDADKTLSNFIRSELKKIAADKGKK